MPCCILPDDGGSDLACSQNQPFTAEPWVDPGPGYSGACTNAQLNALVNAFPDDNMFSAWLSDPTNAGCAQCAAPQALDGGQSVAGAVLIYDLGGGVSVRAPNFGGCLEILDGMRGVGSCGEKYEDSSVCTYFECGQCSDYLMPSPGGPYDQCVQQTNGDSTECKSFVPSQACASELMMAPTDVCATFDVTMIEVFCGQRDGGPPEAGSDALIDAPLDTLSDSGGDGGG